MLKQSGKCAYGSPDLGVKDACRSSGVPGRQSLLTHYRTIGVLKSNSNVRPIEQDSTRVKAPEYSHAPYGFMS